MCDTLFFKNDSYLVKLVTRNVIQIYEQTTSGAVIPQQPNPLCSVAATTSKALGHGNTLFSLAHCSLFFSQNDNQK